MRKRDKANFAVGESIICAGSFLCPLFKLLIGRLHEIHPIIDWCEITVFFPNCLKKVVFITSSNSMSFKPSVVFISLRHYEVIILQSGMHSITLAFLINELG